MNEHDGRCSDCGADLEPMNGVMLSICWSCNERSNEERRPTCVNCEQPARTDHDSDRCEACDAIAYQEREAANALEAP